MEGSLHSHRQPMNEERKDLLKSTDPRLNAFVTGLTRRCESRCDRPSFEDVRNYLANQFLGADDFAGAFYRAMERNHWLDSVDKPIHDWRCLARAYASKCELNRRG